jgi:cysteine desulfurase
VHTVYLDFNSTTPLAPSVREAMEPFWSDHFMLPGQGHRGCRAVADALENAREGVAGMIDSDPLEIVFTGGGTEANNLAVLGVANRSIAGQIIISALEHDSVCKAATSLESRGWSIEIAPANDAGVVTVDAVAKLLRPETRLVCLQSANPVLGTCQPVREIADMCHGRGIPVHCDAVQSFGKEPLRVADLRADTIAISGHKFYGPKGVGALFVRRGFAICPVSFGQNGEMGLRPGTENVCGWVGLGAAARLAGRCAAEAGAKMGELRERFIERLNAQLVPQARLLCAASPSLPNTMVVELPGEASRISRTARQLVMATPQSATPADEMTRCLQAIGLPTERIRRCCRVSLGWTTSQDQVDRAADLLAEACDLV